MIDPKGEAKEIIGKFYFSSIRGALIYAKKFDLIAVNEIIELDNFSVEGREYYKEVKKEIEKL